MFPLRRLLGLSAARIRCGRIPVRIPHGVDHRHTDHPRAVRPRRMRDAGTRPAGGTADDRRSPADARRPAIGTRTEISGQPCFLCRNLPPVPGRDMRPERRPAVPLSRPDTPFAGIPRFRHRENRVGTAGHRTEVERTRIVRTARIFHTGQRLFSSRPANDGSW